MYLKLLNSITRNKLAVEGRLAQAKELENLLKRQNIPKSEPVIMAGDFNLDFYAQVS